MKKIIETHLAPLPIGPYSQGVKVGNTLYISGQIAMDQTTGEMTLGTIEEETHMVLKNIEAILEDAGMTMQNVVKCSIFLQNLNDFEKINQVYGQYFEKNPPARETVEVARLPKGAYVEISAIAYQSEV